MPANVTKLAAEEGMWLPARPVEGWSSVTLERCSIAMILIAWLSRLHART